MRGGLLLMTGRLLRRVGDGRVIGATTKRRRRLPSPVLDDSSGLALLARMPSCTS